MYGGNAFSDITSTRKLHMLNMMDSDERYQHARAEIVRRERAALQRERATTMMLYKGDGERLRTIYAWLQTVPALRNARPTAVTGLPMSLLFEPRYVEEPAREFTIPAGAVIKVIKKQAPCTIVITHDSLSLTLERKSGPGSPWCFRRATGFNSTGRAMVGKSRGAGPDRCLS